MNNIKRIKLAQKRALKLIANYEELGWVIPESIKIRATMDIPSKISDTKTQAIVDNLSASTIRTLRRMGTNISISETTPIITGTYKSGARIYDVSKQDKPTTITKNISISERNIADLAIKQIKFVMENAPTVEVAERVEKALTFVENYGTSIFKTNDRTARRAALVDYLKSDSEVKKAIKEAEKNGYPATLQMLNIYKDLVDDYGVNEKGLAARQMRINDEIVESVGRRIGGTDRVQRALASRVLNWLIANDHIWQEYRRKMKLKKIVAEYYDSDSLLQDVSTVMVENPEYDMELLDYLLDMMKDEVDPAKILENMEARVDKIRELNTTFKK